MTAQELQDMAVKALNRSHHEPVDVAMQSLAEAQAYAALATAIHLGRIYAELPSPLDVPE